MNRHALSAEGRRLITRAVPDRRQDDTAKASVASCAPSLSGVSPSNNFGSAAAIAHARVCASPVDPAQDRCGHIAAQFAASNSRSLAWPIESSAGDIVARKLDRLLWSQIGRACSGRIRALAQHDTTRSAE